MKVPSSRLFLGPQWDRFLAGTWADGSITRGHRSAFPMQPSITTSCVNLRALIKVCFTCRWFLNLCFCGSLSILPVMTISLHLCLYFNTLALLINYFIIKGEFSSKENYCLYLLIFPLNITNYPKATSLG